MDALKAATPGPVSSGTRRREVEQFWERFETSHSANHVALQLSRLTLRHRVPAERATLIAFLAFGEAQNDLK